MRISKSEGGGVSASVAEVCGCVGVWGGLGRVFGTLGAVWTLTFGCNSIAVYL